MSCGCGKPETTNYVGKQILFGGEWFTCLTQDRITGAIGFIKDDKLVWVRISRVEGIR